jgi:hypothetical protein
VLDEKRQVGLECRVLAEFFAAISAILDNRDRRDGIGQDLAFRPLDGDLDGFHAVAPATMIVTPMAIGMASMIRRTA